LIAPETGGILAERTRAIENAGCRGLGSSAQAVELTGDKLQLGEHLARRGIVTPPCRRVVPRRGLPIDFRYPAVLKPIDGAGGQDTYLIRAPDACPRSASTLPFALLQPLVPGVPHSASFLVGRDGRARLIAAGLQRVEIHEDRYSYHGGTLPTPPHGVAEGPRPAVECVPGLFGFVGVDYMWDQAARLATVLEINPRPTTSYVGLTKSLPPGMLARAWLDLITERADARRGEPLLPDLDLRKTVTFAADGAMMQPSEGDPS
jgi:predicted ATP-grasp superfamily ATP-dependent carboligase